MPQNGQTPPSAPSCVPTPSLLGIETSCDETAAAVFSLEGRLLSNLVASQHEVHGRFGGVVPELASRKHVERIEEITQAALNQAGWVGLICGRLRSPKGRGLPVRWSWE